MSYGKNPTIKELNTIINIVAKAGGIIKCLSNDNKNLRYYCRINGGNWFTYEWGQCNEDGLHMLILKIDGE